MPVDVMRENDSIVEALQTAVHRGEFGLGSVPALIKRVIEEHRWQERFVRVTGTETRFNRFTEFIAAEPPEGLGAELPAIKRLCADDPVALDLIDQTTTRPYGGDRKSEVIKVDIVNLDKGSLGPSGNSAQHAIRKLRKDRPDLHAKVLAKELSPHAAMVEAGFRRKTVSVPVDDPDKVSTFLAKHFNATEIRAIADLAVVLTEGEG